MQGNVRVLAVALVLTITENTQNNATLSINFVYGFARDVIRNMSPIEYSAADLTSRNEFGRLKRKQIATEMVRRYAHLAADHLGPYAERLSALRAVEKTDGTNTAQA